MPLSNAFHVLSPSEHGNKIIFFTMSVIIFVLIVDTILVKIYPFTTSQSLSSWRTGVFVIIAIVSMYGQYYVMDLAKNKNKEVIRKKALHLDAIQRIVFTTQFGMLAILVFIILQMTFMSRYSVVTLSVTTGISYTLAAILLGVLAMRFFLWYRSNGNSVVLLFSISSGMLAISTVLTLLFVIFILTGLPAYVRPHIGFISPTPIPGSITSILNYPYFISAILSFILSWIATAALLSHYSKKFGRIKYYTIISIPLVYFMIQFLPLFPNLISAVASGEPILFNIIYTSIFTLSKPAGGIVFGVAFLTISRSVGKTAVRDYMIISAFGFILLFTSNQATVLVSAPYPPFGLPTILFMSLSSFSILMGIYSAAISVAQDANLRQSIRKFAVKESRLLDSIGSAHMQKEIEKRVIAMSKAHEDKLKEETGLVPSFDDEDIKKYLEEVLQEVKMNRDRERSPT